MKNFVTFSFFILLTGLCKAQPKIWSCVVYAKAGQGSIDPILNNYTNEMKRIFGYCHYDVIGSRWSTHSIDQPNWIMPTKEFFLKLTPLTNWNNLCQFEMELYQKREILLKSRFRMPHQSPLYIAGPSYGKGKIIIILEVKTQPQD